MLVVSPSVFVQVSMILTSCSEMYLFWLRRKIPGLEYDHSWEEIPGSWGLNSFPNTLVYGTFGFVLPIDVSLNVGFRDIFEPVSKRVNNAYSHGY